MRKSLKRALALLAVALPLAFAVSAAANHEPMDGQSFLFLQPGFTQDVYGIYPSFLGGVAFVPSDGDPLTNLCSFDGSSLQRYDRQGVAPPPPADPTTELHPVTTVPSSAGCGMTNHPNGSIYTNTSAGVRRLNPETGAPIGGPFGPAGNALGIAVDPETSNLVYVGSDGTMFQVDPGLTTTSTFSSFTAGRFIDGIAFDPSGDFLFLASRSPGFTLLIINGDTGAFIQDVPMTAEPDGISFHATTPKFVVTNNTNGTMSRFDFPADNYTLPPVQSVFASGGFRGDLSNVGPDGCIYLTQDGVRFDNGAISSENSLVKICPGFAPPPGVEICGDGIDNDGDGEIDEDCPTVGVVQHYTGYDLDEPERFFENVTLVDQFGVQRVRVEEAEVLLTPAEKRRTGEDPAEIVDEDAHLVCHGLGILPVTERTVTVRNQFTDGSVLTTGRATMLCVPASKTLTGPAGAPPEDLDHYLCYDVRAETPRFTSETLGTTDQFGARTDRVDRARELCNPVEKRRDGMPAETILLPEEHLVCYRITSFTPSFAARNVNTNDQFGADTTRVVTLRRLCVPSSKDDGGGGDT